MKLYDQRPDERTAVALVYDWTEAPRVAASGSGALGEQIIRLAAEHGVKTTTFVPRDDPDDCILCGLCTRACDKVGAHAITTAQRGDVPGRGRLALVFLASDPLPFFRERVVLRLSELMADDPGFAPDEPMTSESNRRALARVARHFGLDPP